VEKAMVDVLTSKRAVNLLTEIIGGIVSTKGKTALLCVKNGVGMKIVPINFNQDQFCQNGEILAQQALKFCAHCANQCACHPATLQTGGTSLILIGLEKNVDVNDENGVKTIKNVGEFCLIYFAYKMNLLTKQEALSIDNWFTKFFI